VAAQLAHALADAGESDASARTIAMKADQKMLRHSGPRIFDAEHRPPGFNGQTDIGAGTFGVPMNVGQAFLQYAKQSELNCRGQAQFLFRQVELDGDTAAEATPDSSSKGGCSRYDMVRVSPMH